MHILNSSAKPHQGGAGVNALGLWSCTPESASAPPPPVGLGRGGVSTGLTCRRKEEGKRGMRTSLFLWDPKHLLAALNSSVWDCQHSWCWIISAKMSIMRIYSSAGEGWDKPASGKTALLRGNPFTRVKICSLRQVIPAKIPHNERSHRIYHLQEPVSWEHTLQRPSKGQWRFVMERSMADPGLSPGQEGPNSGHVPFWR